MTMDLWLQDIFFLDKQNCIMIENISSSKSQLQLRFAFKHKNLKSKVRRINLKWILLNQLKWILDELFRILCGWQPSELITVFSFVAVKAVKVVIYDCKILPSLNFRLVLLNFHCSLFIICYLRMQVH